MNEFFNKYSQKIFLLPLIFLAIFTIFVFIRDESVDARIEARVELAQNSVYGGVHAPLAWFSLGGGATTTENILVTSTPYFSGKFPTSRAVIDDNGNIFLMWSDPTAADAGWRLNGARFDAESNRWRGFGTENPGGSVLFTSTTALSTSIGLAPIIDNDGGYAAAWIDANSALRDAYFARWNSGTDTWESLSSETRFDGALVTSANQLIGPTLDKDAVGNLYFTYVEVIGGKRRVKLGKIVGTNLEGPVSGAAGPDEPLVLAGFTTNDSFVYFDFALDVVGKPYVIAQHDVAATSLDPIYTTRFDGTQWAKWGSDVAGYDAVFDQTPYGTAFSTSAALKRVGSKIFASFSPKFSSGEFTAPFFPHFDISAQTWKSPSGNYTGTTSTESRAAPAGAASVTASGADAASNGTIYAGWRNTTEGAIYASQWDPATFVWRGIVATTTNQEDLIASFNLSQANYNAMAPITFTDQNDLPVYIFRAKDPANESNDAIFGVRALHVTSTPTVISLGQILPENTSQHQRANISCDCDTNGGAIDFEISLDGVGWFGKQPDGNYVFPYPSETVYARAIITPETSGARSPVIRSVDFQFEPAGKRAFLQEHIPAKPIIDGVVTTDPFSVTYNFHQGSTDTTGYRVVSVNEIATSAEIIEIKNILDSGNTDQSALTTLTEQDLLPGNTYCNRALIGFNEHGDSEPALIPCFTLPSLGEGEQMTDADGRATSTIELGGDLPNVIKELESQDPFDTFIPDYNFWDGVQLVRVKNQSDVYLVSENIAYKVDRLTRTALGYSDEFLRSISQEEFDRFTLSLNDWTSYKIHPEWTRIFVREQEGLFVLRDKVLYPINELYEREVLADQGIAVISQRFFDYTIAK